MNYEMDFNVRMVRWSALGILVLAIGLVTLSLVFGPRAFENWYLSLIFLGCFGALISAALRSLDKRIKEIESKLDESG